VFERFESLFAKDGLKLRSQETSLTLIKRREMFLELISYCIVSSKFGISVQGSIFHTKVKRSTPNEASL